MLPLQQVSTGSKLSMDYVTLSISKCYSITQQNFKVVKITIKENNVGDKTRFYVTFHEAGSLLSENCKMEPKAECFYRIKNKGQRREKYKICD